MQWKDVIGEDCFWRDDGKADGKVGDERKDRHRDGETRPAE